MNYYDVKGTDLKISVLGYGCMNIGQRWDQSVLEEKDIERTKESVMTAFEQGINFFDHADIYTYGKSEVAFGELLYEEPSLRQQMIIQTKCGIRFQDEPKPGSPHRYDFSAQHIVKSVNESLDRLQTDYIDILLLHRPDPLCEPEEVAIAFAELHSAGKVRHFGVSNHTSMQIELLKKYVDYPILFNQIELNLIHNQLIYEGINFNQDVAIPSLTHGTLDYCRLNDIIIQAWSPLAKGLLTNDSLNKSEIEIETSELLEDMAVSKHSTPEGIMLSWLLKHPAGIQPIIGTTKARRILDACKAVKVELTREEWYHLLNTAKGKNLP